MNKNSRPYLVILQEEGACDYSIGCGMRAEIIHSDNITQELIDRSINSADYYFSPVNNRELIKNIYVIDIGRSFKEGIDPWEIKSLNELPNYYDTIQEKLTEHNDYKNSECSAKRERYKKFLELQAEFGGR